MFSIALVILIIFTLVYALLSSAVFYHLRQYTLPGFPTPNIATFSYVFISILFWLFALTFLFKLPS